MSKKEWTFWQQNLHNPQISRTNNEDRPLLQNELDGLLQVTNQIGHAFNTTKYKILRCLGTRNAAVLAGWGCYFESRHRT